MLKLSISPDGEITGIYSDALADLCGEGRAEVARASHVEPVMMCKECAIGYANDDYDNPLRCPSATLYPEKYGVTGWLATMNDGTKIGPFRLRETALAAEVDYLERQLGL